LCHLTEKAASTWAGTYEQKQTSIQHTIKRRSYCCAKGSDPGCRGGACNGGVSASASSVQECAEKCVTEGGEKCDQFSYGRTGKCTYNTNGCHVLVYCGGSNYMYTPDIKAMNARTQVKLKLGFDLNPDGTVSGTGTDASKGAFTWTGTYGANDIDAHKGYHGRVGSEQYTGTLEAVLEGHSGEVVFEGTRTVFEQGSDSNVVSQEEFKSVESSTSLVMTCPAPPRPPPTPSPTPPPTVACKEDKHQHCNFYKREGYCTGRYAAWMAQKCATTCCVDGCC